MNALKKSPALLACTLLITMAMQGAVHADGLSSAIDAGPAAVQQYRDRLANRQLSILSAGPDTSAVR